MLYPKTTETRTRISLDGIWDFSLLNTGWEQNFSPAEELKNPMAMPVPASYNDIYEGRSFRDHVGDLAYQRKVTVPGVLLKEHLELHFESVTHKAAVYWNGELLGEHKGGFLPFGFSLDGKVKAGENLLTVIVNNVVDFTTLPVGHVETRTYPNLPPRVVNCPQFDFFNYSGIMRPVCLYARPHDWIRDITVQGHCDGSFSWKVEAPGPVTVNLLDSTGACLFAAGTPEGQGKLACPRLWSPEDPYLYTLDVRTGEDSYRETFGFRDVEIRDCALYLNGKKIYLRGFGKHEDAPVSGRGYNPVYNVKDIGLMKLLGANSMRTSHYPYSEEFLGLCDREGILVIDEAPAVGLNTGFTAVGQQGGKPKGTWDTLQTGPHHREVLRDLVSRDKNHPCVICWSVANEPASQEPGAKEYFAPLMDQVRNQDPQHRPVTIVTYGASTPTTCQVAELCDILVLNRYWGWYDTEGDLEAAGELLRQELEGFHRRCPDKPIMLGEFGADTVSGMHNMTPSLFSEEYQAQMLEVYGQVLDSLPYAAGEHVWNFADFATAENIKRVQGNKKGIFTRDRNPKLAAFTLQKRWTSMKNRADSSSDC